MRVARGPAFRIAIPLEVGRWDLPSAELRYTLRATKSKTEEQTSPERSSASQQNRIWEM